MNASLEIQVAEAARRRDGMTGRERLEAALARRPVDRVPVSFKRIDPFDGANPRLRSDPNYRRLTEIAGRYTDVFHDWRFELNAPLYARSPDARVAQCRSADGRTTRTVVSTGGGTLTQEERAQQGSTWTVQPLIETEADLGVFLAHSWEPLEPDLDGYWREAQQLGDRGLMRVSLLDPLGMVAMLLDREVFYTWVLTPNPPKGPVSWRINGVRGREAAGCRRRVISCDAKGCAMGVREAGEGGGRLG